jgi:hypothetical protein
MKRFAGGGRKSIFPDTTLIKMKEFFDKKRSENLSVTVQLIAVETRKVDPVSCDALKDDALQMRIHCLLKRWEISWRQSTNKA